MLHPLDLTQETTLILSNEDINGIMKVVKSLKESDLLIKRVSERITNEAKKMDFLAWY